MNKIKTWWAKGKRIFVHEFTSEPPKKVVANVLWILFGAFIYAIGDAFFILPMNILSGGVSSLAIISHWIPGMNALSTQVYIYIYTWGFFLLGLIFIGLKYSLKTLLFAVAYPLFDQLFTWIISIAVVDGVHIFDLSNIAIAIPLSNGSISPDNEGLLPVAYLLSGIFGGTLQGCGIGLTFVGGGSSGGTDVINILVNKYFNIRVGTSSFIVDVLIILGGFFANGHNFFATLVGLLTDFLCSSMIDRVFLGMNQYYLALITSVKWKEINDFINLNLGRGTTLLTGKGGYTKNDLTVIEVCFDRQDYNLIKQSIYSIDPNAFVSVMSTKEILGYGFSRDKPKVDSKDISVSPDDTRRLVAKAKRNKRRLGYYDDINK